MTLDYLQMAMKIDKSTRQLLTESEFMIFLFSQGCKQADIWFEQILPVATMCQYKTIFKETYIKKRASAIRAEFGLDREEPIGASFPALKDYADYFIPKGYEITEYKGITRFNTETLMQEVVFPHAIIVSSRFINLQTGEHKAEILSYDNGIIKNIFIDLMSISSNQAILNLAKNGVRVNSKNAMFLVVFLADFIDCNVQKIPLLKSTSILGWHGSEFLPYGKNIRLEAKEDDADNVLNSIHCKGNFEQWKDVVKKSCKNDYVRLGMATSISSCLMEITEKPIFITHIWGKTGTAKTVALYLALSVFGNPVNMTCQWNGTPIGCEQTMSALKDIPFGMNEGELLTGIGNQFKSFGDFIYLFCEGKERAKGGKEGDPRTKRKWNNNCLSNGETSLKTETSKGGELNRVLEFMTDESLFANEEMAIETANFAKKNYGYSGELITNRCKDYDLKEYWTRFFDVIKECYTKKQAGQMASLLLGDLMLQAIIFEVEEEKAFQNSLELLERQKRNLKTDEDVDITIRAEQFLKDWISQNSGNFLGDHNNFIPNQIYGIIQAELIYINNNIFNDVMVKNGYNLEKIKSDFKNKNIFQKMGKDTPTILKKIKGISTRCYCFSLNGWETVESGDLPEQFKVETVTGR